MADERISEEQGDRVIDILRHRLGMRYRSSLEKGRDDIVDVLREELGLERARADAMVSRLIESGQIHYVTADEQDVAVDGPVENDAQPDSAREVGGDRGPTDDVIARPVVPPGGGTQVGPAGTTGAAMPVAGSGTGSPAAIPLTQPDPHSTGVAAGGRSGYWDIRGDKAGVVPSSTRKGQVEPRGT